MPESLEDVLPVSRAPADNEHPPGSNDKDDDTDRDGGGSGSGGKDALAVMWCIMNVNDDLAEDEDPLPLEIPTRHVLESSTPAAPTATLFKGHILLQLGIGWRKGPITQQADSPHLRT